MYNDALGYKYVEGETFEDAIFGQGFAQCRDRLWQMNFLRGLASGTLGSFLGPPGHDIDVLIRMFGLSQAGQRAAERVKAEDLEM